MTTPGEMLAESEAQAAAETRSTDERAVRALERLANAFERIATAKESIADDFHTLEPHLEEIPKKMLDMIEQGFGTRVIK